MAKAKIEAVALDSRIAVGAAIPGPIWNPPLHAAARARNERRAMPSNTMLHEMIRQLSRTRCHKEHKRLHCILCGQLTKNHANARGRCTIALEDTIQMAGGTIYAIRDGVD